MQGSYLTNNKICADDRLGQVYYQQKLLFSKEDLQKLSGEEIEAIINKEFHHDDYEWNKIHHININPMARFAQIFKICATNAQNVEKNS